MNAGFENQTTLNALIGTGVTDGSAYATGKPSFRILAFLTAHSLTTPNLAQALFFKKTGGKNSW
ncbi:MAG: hypothetical protein IJL92_04020 [Thermoguttaceae bacterium]|nr:hypothetical protein [Thermoguttaceae bacterium]